MGTRVPLHLNPENVFGARNHWKQRTRRRRWLGPWMVKGPLWRFCGKPDTRGV
jgi:hypothetical protein